jgi:signal transduction histidine kinase
VEEQPAKILIVDDSAETIRLLSGILKDQYQVIVAKDGEKALERASNPCPPDLILLDVIMPGMDGYEVCRRLKQTPQTRDIPVIFTTIRDEERDETRGFEAGAVDYIGKPLRASILKARIKTHLELKRHREELEELVAERTAALRKANQEKEDALRTKNEFLSCVTHELRTPMSGVIGISDVMRSRSTDPEEHKLLGLIRSSASAQMRLIDDILDFARLELGKGESEQGEVYLDLVIKTVSDMFLPQIHEKELKFTSHIDPAIPSRLMGDIRLLRQTLMNLLGNAVKFTDEGSVEVRVTPRQPIDTQPGAALELIFEIRDTGVGIAEEKKEMIFEGFAQADSSNTRRFPGLGLGLSTAKRMVDLMGGEISLESEEHKGALFRFNAGFNLPNDPPL